MQAVGTITTLKNEAEKYDSAEEFVKSQGEVVYHGTNQEFDQFQMSEEQDRKGYTSGEGFWFTRSKEEAQQYAELSAMKKRTQLRRTQEDSREAP